MRLGLLALITLPLVASSIAPVLAHDDTLERRGSSAENSNRGGELRGHDRAEQRHRMKSEKPPGPKREAHEPNERDGAGSLNGKQERDRTRSREHKPPK